MKRNWRGERDWWLDHFFQWSPNSRRRSGSPRITQDDYLAIPLPLNMPTPLASPCLIWRWALDSSGYGICRGRGAHVVSFEQSRGENVGEGQLILHLCHRPFCVQPAHLYEGSAKENATDTRTVHSELGMYQTWHDVGDRWEKASSEFYLAAPPVEGLRTSFGQPLECPHQFARAAGDARLCANCGVTNPESVSGGHRTRCEIERPDGSTFVCRCMTEPCNCKMCLGSESGGDIIYQEGGSTA